MTTKIVTIMLVGDRASGKTLLRNFIQRHLSHLAIAPAHEHEGGTTEQFAVELTDEMRAALAFVPNGDLLERVRRAEALAMRVAGLNPRYPAIGDGMLASLVEDARRIVNGPAGMLGQDAARSSAGVPEGWIYPWPKGTRVKVPGDDRAGRLSEYSANGQVHVSFPVGSWFGPATALTLWESYRDVLGRKVREAWVRWAKTQPNPKASWLVPYDELSEPDKEADRQIGEALAAPSQPVQPEGVPGEDMVAAHGQPRIGDGATVRRAPEHG